MNTLSVDRMPDGRIRTEILLCDGTKIMELHRNGLHDSKVLRAMLERKYYQHLKGFWTINFSGPSHSIQRPSFESAVDQAQEYIFSRDNSIDYSGFC